MDHHIIHLRKPFKLNILQVAQRTYPAIGGVELHTAMISKKLVERGHKVTIAVLNSIDQRDCGFGIKYVKPYLVTKPIKPHLPKEEYWNGVRILRFQSKAQFFTYYWSPDMLFWLINNIKKFDIVHTHSLRFSNNEFTVIAHILNKHKTPIVITCHDACALNYMGPLASTLDVFYRKIIGRKLIQRFDRLIALTEENFHEHIKYLYAEPDKIRIVPNGIDFDKYDKLPNPSDLREKLENPEQVILFIGRFTPHKNPDKLISAFKKVSDKYPKSHLLMIGKDYGMFGYCKKLASDLKNQITLLESSPEEIKLKALALADICVVPSSYEGFGIVALEAQASGVPIIAAKKGGLKDVIINNVTGLHIDPTSNQISNAIEYLLERPDLRSKMGIEAKTFAKEFSWENVAIKLEKVYQDVMLVPDN